MANKVGEWITPVMVALVGGLVGAVYSDLKQDLAAVQAGQVKITERFADVRERIAHTEAQIDDMKRWQEWSSNSRRSLNLFEHDKLTDDTVRRVKKQLESPYANVHREGG